MDKEKECRVRMGEERERERKESLSGRQEDLNNRARTTTFKYRGERNGMKNNWSFDMGRARLLERVQADTLISLIERFKLWSLEGSSNVLQFILVDIYSVRLEERDLNYVKRGGWYRSGFFPFHSVLFYFCDQLFLLKKIRVIRYAYTYLRGNMINYNGYNG